MRHHPKYGYSCPTPVTKSADGKTVLEWCAWKPEGGDGHSADTFNDNVPPFRDGDEGPESKQTFSNREDDGPDWNYLGRVKALCGMVNARLSGLRPVDEIQRELPIFTVLIRAIEAEAQNAVGETKSR